MSTVLGHVVQTSDSGREVVAKFPLVAVPQRSSVEWRWIKAGLGRILCTLVCCSDHFYRYERGSFAFRNENHASHAQLSLSLLGHMRNDLRLCYLHCSIMLVQLTCAHTHGLSLSARSVVHVRTLYALGRSLHILLYQHVQYPCVRAVRPGTCNTSYCIL